MLIIGINFIFTLGKLIIIKENEYLLIFNIIKLKKKILHLL